MTAIDLLVAMALQPSPRDTAIVRDCVVIRRIPGQWVPPRRAMRLVGRVWFSHTVAGYWVAPQKVMECNRGLFVMTVPETTP